MSIKILHLISSLNRGGRERQLAIIVSQTDMGEYPSKIIFFNKSKKSYTEDYGLSKFSRRIEAGRSITRLLELNKVLKSEDPDIVYSWGNGESLAALLLKPFHKYKFINGSIRHGIRSMKISQYLRTIVLHFSSNIVANSKAGLKANNLKNGFVLYNGIGKEIFEPQADKQAQISTLPNIPENAIKLISVANLVPYKDYFTILEALEILHKESYEFHYLILGEGKMRNKIEHAINTRELQDYVQIVGHTETVADYLKISDIFIHSSKGEGCSNAVLEAMASGLPVIASDTGGTSEIITPDIGYLFEYKNVKQLASILQYCLDNINECKLIGRTAQNIVRNKYSSKQMMNNYYSMINKVKTHPK